MEEPKEFTERWRQRLYGAQTDLIDLYGGCRRVVDNLPVSKSQVGRWYGGADRDSMPTPVVMALEGYVGRPMVSAIMIEFLGLEFAGAGKPTEGFACLSSLSADLAEASGRMVVETVRAKADGVVTPSEAQQLRAQSRKIGKLTAAIDDELARVVAREEAGEAQP